MDWLKFKHTHREKNITTDQHERGCCAIESGNPSFFSIGFNAENIQNVSKAVSSVL